MGWRRRVARQAVARAAFRARLPVMTILSTPASPSGSTTARALARLEVLRAITDVPGQIHRLFLSPAHRRAVAGTQAQPPGSASGGED